MIKEIYGKILDEVLNWISHIKLIKAFERGDSSADEDEEPEDWIIHKIQEIRSVHMAKIEKEFYNLEPFLEINREFRRIILLTSSKNENFKEVDNFYKTEIYRMWSMVLGDIDKADDLQLLQYEDKNKDSKKNLSKKIEEIKEAMEKLIKEKLIFSSNTIALNSVEKIKNAYNNASKIYEDYTKFQKEKIKSRTRTRTRR